MSFSRRKFMKAGAVAAACAFLPLKSAFGQKGSQGGDGIMTEGPPISPSAKNKLEQLNYYNESSFSPYVNTQFRVYLDPSSTRSLKLTEVSDYLKSLPKSLRQSQNSAQTECFSLLLTALPGNTFTQDTYLIEHDALGAFYLFLVPVGQQGKGIQDYYEAVVYRDAQQDIWSKSAPTGETNQAGAQRPQARATAGLAREQSVGVRQAEQDVFYFRPERLEANKPVEPKPVPGAAGRRAASKMGLSQAPDISGLRLGMTLDEVLALFPAIKDDEKLRASLSAKPNQFGMRSLAINPSKYSVKWELDGVTYINFTFVDERVSGLYITYKDPVWEHVDAFVEKFSEENRLPGADSWDAYVGMDTQLKTLKCGGFEISLFAGGDNVALNYVRMSDTAAQQLLKERKEKAKKLKSASS